MSDGPFGGTSHLERPPRCRSRDACGNSSLGPPLSCPAGSSCLLNLLNLSLVENKEAWKGKAARAQPPSAPASNLAMSCDLHWLRKGQEISFTLKAKLFGASMENENV